MGSVGWLLAPVEKGNRTDKLYYFGRYNKNRRPQGGISIIGTSCEGIGITESGADQGQDQVLPIGIDIRLHQDGLTQGEHKHK